MLTINNAKIKDIIYIKRIINNVSQNANFHSEFNSSIIKHVLKKTCFLVYENYILQCILFFHNDYEVFVIPTNKTFSFFKLLYILKNDFKNNEYKLKIKYKKLNISMYKKYYNIKIKENYLYMYLDILSKNTEIDYNNSNDLFVRKMKIGHEENIRVMLQNDIFSKVKDRIELTLNEVIYEENSSKFLKNLCFFIEYKGSPIGYGQIIKTQNSYYLVNFGIVQEFQGRGFGYYFLNEIIKSCKANGIEKLYLTVDSNNKKAINLYKKYGFEFLYGSASIILKNNN
ncbi:GNAT family N-acetyltransferase [Caloramator sp. E03]|uniref:GNAT family N-acetyltransferase n=1 Tax=Caloramator sp. E03 TaxID=2576307 RepID=UPI00143D824A|nr:GNAT family N-acetyltransferase [Caloramator sp. E03]